jgi:hypothetical protein
MIGTATAAIASIGSQWRPYSWRAARTICPNARRARR